MIDLTFYCQYPIPNQVAADFLTVDNNLFYVGRQIVELEIKQEETLMHPSSEWGYVWCSGIISFVEGYYHMKDDQQHLSCSLD